MGSPVKVITVESLEDKIKEMEVVRDVIKDVLIFPLSTSEEKVKSKYIELQGAAKVAEYMNNEGYRIKSTGKLGERKYNSNDVTDIINAPVCDTDEGKLNQLAKVLYHFNIGKAAWNTIVRLCKNL